MNENEALAPATDDTENNIKDPKELLLASAALMAESLTTAEIATDAEIKKMLSCWKDFLKGALNVAASSDTQRVIANRVLPLLHTLTGGDYYSYFFETGFDGPFNPTMYEPAMRKEPRHERVHLAHEVPELTESKAPPQGTD